MSVLLIQPPEAKGRITAELFPNYSLGYLATALLNEGIDTEILDMRIKKMTIDEAMNYFRSFDLIGFFMFSTNFNWVKECSRRIKEAGCKAQLIAGGPHAIFEPVDTLKKISWLDFVCHGEGEETLTALVRGEKIEEIPNLAWRDEDGRIRLNPKKFIDDLDLYPMPAWELTPPTQYPTYPQGIFSSSKRVAPMIATRGCPFSCTFCGAPKASGKFIRKRSVGRIVEEMEYLSSRWGIEEIHFGDANFTYDKEFAKDLCRGIIKSGLKVRWACPNGLRIDRLDEELLTLMEEAGCWSIAVAIESGSQRVLDELLKKELSLEMVRRQMNFIKKKTKIQVTGFFMIGIPSIFGHKGETFEEMEMTIELARSLPLDRVAFFVFTPYPGSLKYRELKMEGKIDEIDFEKLDMHYAGEWAEISRDEMRKIVFKAYVKFYFRPRILWNLMWQIKTFSQFKQILTRVLGFLM